MAEKYIEELAAEFAVDYKPAEDDLIPQAYAEHGFIAGYQACENRGASPSYRQITREEAERLWFELRDEALDEFGEDDHNHDFDAEWFGRDLIYLNLPTGVMPVVIDRGSITVAHHLFCEHGRRYEEVHHPERVNLVGGSAPF